MKDVLISITGVELDYELARSVAQQVAEQDEEEVMLISWMDSKREKHSPQCVRCQIGDTPGWEVYGENHGGRLKIIINDREYVFIYS